MRRLGIVLGLALAPVVPALHAGDVVEYYHLDGLGNVRAVTNQAGQVIERHDYLPFGEECTTGPCASNPGVGVGQPRKFTGKERDAETGLDYFGARYYGSKIGRFTTVDPYLDTTMALVDPQRWNRYAYGRNNPLRYVDPDGRDIFDYFGGVITAFGSNLAFGYGRPSGGNEDFQFGQTVGDTMSLLAAGAEAHVGGGLIVGGTGATATGVLAELGVPAAAAGLVLAGRAATVAGSATLNLAKNNAGSGSYTITFESNKRYHGKGGEDRARASAKRVGAENQGHRDAD